MSRFQPRNVKEKKIKMLYLGKYHLGIQHDTFEFHPGSGNRDEIMISFPELKTFNWASMKRNDQTPRGNLSRDQFCPRDETFEWYFLRRNLSFTKIQGNFYEVRS